MQRTLYICLLCAALFLAAPTGFASGSVQAQETGAPRFFEELPDIPLMDHMVELEEQTLVFDKAYGRLIESRALTDVTDVEKIRSFYKGSLDAFGWQPIGEDRYRRGRDTLHFDYEPQQNSLLVTITLKSSDAP